jgi:hypothetical protein
MRKSRTPKPGSQQQVVGRLVRKLQYMQKKARAHELRAASNGHYKVAIMQRAAWDTLREVQDVIREMKSSNEKLSV